MVGRYWEETGVVQAGGEDGASAWKLRIYGVFPAGQFAIDDGRARRRREAKKRLGERRIELPVAELEFDGGAARIGDDDPGQFAGLRGDFDERGRRLAGPNGALALGCCGAGFPQDAGENFVSGIYGALAWCVRHFGAHSGELQFAGKQCQRRAPVLARLGRHAGYGVVAGDINPSSLAIHYELALFGRLVIPAHAAGLAKIGDACFGTNNAAVFQVTFEEGGLQGGSGAIPGFRFNDGGSSRRRGAESDGQAKSKQQSVSAKHGNIVAASRAVERDN